MKRQRFRLSSLIAAAVLLCWMRPALALWSIADVTASGVYGTTKITVKTTNADKFKEFEVIVEPKGKEFPAYLDGRLKLTTKNEDVALVSVSGDRQKNAVSYRFRLTSEAADKSLFEIYSRSRKESRGGVIYSVKLKSFVLTAPH